VVAKKLEVRAARADAVLPCVLLEQGCLAARLSLQPLRPPDLCPRQALLLPLAALRLQRRSGADSHAQGGAGSSGSRCLEYARWGEGGGAGGGGGRYAQCS
jgi:uncharacterized membrane protein YgcG